MLGGTIFVGRHFVEAARLRGHIVTILHRGQRGADLFPDIDRILADRDGGLPNFGERTWDAVVDCCGYVPRVVRQSAKALADRVDKYLFISTVSVYNATDRAGIDESAPVGTLADKAIEEITGETYGPLKALCEEEVSKVFGERALIVRPGLIVGPYDPTNRFTYWVDRFANNNKVLVPDLWRQPLQLIDARDLAQWMIYGLTVGLNGVFNATGPEEPKTFGDLVKACLSLNPEARAINGPLAQLEKTDVSLWSDLPLTIPPGSDLENTLRLNVCKAVREGLTFRPWGESAKDVLDWLRGPERKPEKPAYGMTREKELAVLQNLGLRA